MNGPHKLADDGAIDRSISQIYLFNIEYVAGEEGLVATHDSAKLRLFFPKFQLSRAGR